MSTITLEGRQYTVTQLPDSEVHPSNRPGYQLEGPRGARYRTFRKQAKPGSHYMYLVNARDWTKNAPKSWLTDKNGTLEVAR